MPDDFPLTSETAKGVAALGGLEADEATAERIVLSVKGVTAASADFRDEIAFDDAPSDFLRVARASCA